MQLSVEPHPLLDARVFVTRFEPALSAYAERSPLASPPAAPFRAPDATLRGHVRQLLRHSGFKPTGRSKPASEYLARAQEEGGLRPINFAVDVCNLVSLYSGIPISVIDLDLASPPFRIAAAEPGANYPFNSGGQTIDVGQLLCLHDAQGPCANAVKDSQRTKTHDGTSRTLTVMWSSRELGTHTDAALAFYRQLLAAAGCPTEAVSSAT